jgi:flavodoxin
MRAVVVYESMFGNTEAVAHAVAEGLGARMDVDLLEVSKAPAPFIDRVDLMVLGGPTHAFSMSRPSTRAQAVQQGATHGAPSIGLREWLGTLRGGPHAELVATFDTRVDKVRRLPGSAARKAAKMAKGLGYATAGTESFYVRDTAGPLLPGELTRAREWGESLAAVMAARAQGRSAS